MATAMISPDALTSWVVEPSAIRDWAATAPAGAELVYARGVRLPTRCPSAALARRLAEQRQMTLLQRKRGHATDYLMRRLRPAKVSVGRPNKPPRPVLDGDMARLLRVLRFLAREGLPCPDNRTLAKQAGIGNGDQASYVLKKLVAADVVRSTVVGRATGVRVVTIVASGAQTAKPVGAA